MLVTGGHGDFGGGGMPRRIMLNSRPVSVLRTTEPDNLETWHRCEVTDIAVHHAEQALDRFLVRGDRIDCPLHKCPNSCANTLN
jgi:hypothetical protein